MTSAAADAEPRTQGPADHPLAGRTRPDSEGLTVPQMVFQIVLVRPAQQLPLINPDPLHPLLAQLGQGRLQVPPLYTEGGAEGTHSPSSTGSCQYPNGTLWEGGGSLRMLGTSPMAPPPQAYSKTAKEKREGVVLGWTNGQRRLQQMTEGGLQVPGLQLEVLGHSTAEAG